MSTASYETFVTARGTKEEYLSLLRCLRTYADDRARQYREKKDCWYLGDMWNDSIGEVTEEKLAEYTKDGVFRIGLEGPYGIINGPIMDVIDLFERLADAAPTCKFEGEISGFDVGAEQGITARLTDGLLYLRYTYNDYEYRDDWEDDEDEDCENDDTDGEWDTIYDPINHAYRDVSKNYDTNDKVTVTISLTDTNGEDHQLILPSQNIEDPTNFTCHPTKLLEANSVETLIQVLLDSVCGDVVDLRKKDISEFGDTLKNNLGDASFSRLELTKITDHDASLFYGWIKAASVYPNTKKLAKKVCSCTEKDKQKTIDEFKAYLDSFEPFFPWCEFTGWPELCRGGNVHPVLDWSCLANDVEDFAQYICSKNEPREYAVEKVIIDYSAGTIEQSAVYTPGGPKKND